MPKNKELVEELLTTWLIRAYNVRRDKSIDLDATDKAVKNHITQLLKVMDAPKERADYFELIVWNFVTGNISLNECIEALYEWEFPGSAIGGRKLVLRKELED